VRPEGLYQLKIPMTPSGIDPATFRFVAIFLNQAVYINTSSCIRLSMHAHTHEYLQSLANFLVSPYFLLRELSAISVNKKNVVTSGRYANKPVILVMFVIEFKTLRLYYVSAGWPQYRGFN
jgi:hypothetical protein